VTIDEDEKRREEKLYDVSMTYCDLTDSMEKANSMRTAIPLALLATFAISSVNTTCAQTVEWVRQLGTDFEDQSNGISVDRLGNVFISGETGGDLEGVNASEGGAFISKYDADGNLAWTRVLGASIADVSTSVSADRQGNVFISGYTWGDLGGDNAGGLDAFVSKFDTNGNLAWTNQLGTTSFDESSGVSADGLGNVFISGFTSGELGEVNTGSSDAFISKFDTDGNLVWTKQLGTPSFDASTSVSVDGLGNIFISGSTLGDFDGTNAGSLDAFISKFDTDGVLVWTRQLGSSSTEISNAVSADKLGNVFISGYTRSNLDGENAGNRDIFVSKFDTDGNFVWTKQRGTSSWEESTGISADGQGNVFISGFTTGDLDGANAGISDAIVSKYDTDGNLVWSKQLGTDSLDQSNGVITDLQGNVFISGYTAGDFNGANESFDDDAFVMKLIDETFVPEPLADFDNDGDVDGADFLVWQRDTSIGDLADWRAEFATGSGVVTATEEATSSAPEPSSLCLALISGFAIGVYRTRYHFCKRASEIATVHG